MKEDFQYFPIRNRLRYRSATHIELNEQKKNSLNMLVFGLPQSQAVDPVERLKNDAKRGKGILQATQLPQPSEIT